MYVIGSTNDVFATQTGTRAIAPRSSIIETNNSVISIRSKVSTSYNGQWQNLKGEQVDFKIWRRKLVRKVCPSGKNC